VRAGKVRRAAPGLLGERVFRHPGHRRGLGSSRQRLWPATWSERGNKTGEGEGYGIGSSLKGDSGQSGGRPRKARRTTPNSQTPAAAPLRPFLPTASPRCPPGLPQGGAFSALGWVSCLCLSNARSVPRDAESAHQQALLSVGHARRVERRLTLPLALDRAGGRTPLRRAGQIRHPGYGAQAAARLSRDALRYQGQVSPFRCACACGAWRPVRSWLLSWRRASCFELGRSLMFLKRLRAGTHAHKSRSSTSLRSPRSGVLSLGHLEMLSRPPSTTFNLMATSSLLLWGSYRSSGYEHA